MNPVSWPGLSPTVTPPSGLAVVPRQSQNQCRHPNLGTVSFVFLPTQMLWELWEYQSNPSFMSRTLPFVPCWWLRYRSEAGITPREGWCLSSSGDLSGRCFAGLGSGSCVLPQAWEERWEIEVRGCVSTALLLRLRILHESVLSPLEYFTFFTLIFFRKEL